MESFHQSDILVIGAGPAGLMASIAAARSGAKVVVCERLDRPGAKLLASGGGHCNLTNTLPVMEFIQRFGREGRFMLPALSAMDSDRLRRFFRELGVPTHSPDGFHVFPVSNTAKDMLHALLKECEKTYVEFRLRTRITELVHRGGNISGAVADGEEAKAGAVVIATGGKGYPCLGGSGIGYDLAKQAGHTIIEPVPALAALNVKESWPGECAGIALPRVRLWVDIMRRRGEMTEGELLFTHQGISGPAVLDLSGRINRLLLARETVPVRISFTPDVTFQDWIERLKGWQRDERKKLVRNLLSRHIPRRLVDVLSGTVEGIGERMVSELPVATFENLAKNLTGSLLTVTHTAGFDEAMVTAGGVALKQVDPDTLESRLIRGLYFSGELLDMDGPTGGFNLQWAFSSGWLAGSSAVKQFEKN